MRVIDTDRKAKKSSNFYGDKLLIYKLIHKFNSMCSIWELIELRGASFTSDAAPISQLLYHIISFLIFEASTPIDFS